MQRLGKENVRLGICEPELLFFCGKTLNISTHNIRVELFHIDVSDGAAGKRPHLGFVFECSSDL